MTMIEIQALDNGAHNNQTYHGFLPDGWAVIPEDMECENFPFGEVTLEEIDGVMTVTKWVAGVIPERIPESEQPEPSTESDVWDELDKAYQEGYNEGYTEGVNTAYDQ